MASKGETVFTPQRFALLSRMLDEPDGTWFAFGLAQEVGVKASTVYDALTSWAERGWVEFVWEDIDPEVAKRPRRKLYRFSSDGCARARVAYDDHLQQLQRASRGSFLPAPARPGFTS